MNRKMTPDSEWRDDWSSSKVARPIAVTADDEQEFQAAMTRYKHASGRMFPTWSEVFEVLGSLGYAKRIWKPVVAWSPLASPLTVDEATSTFGWYSSAVTSMTP